MFPLYMNIIPYVTHMVYIGLVTHLAFVFLIPHTVREGIHDEFRDISYLCIFSFLKHFQKTWCQAGYGLTPLPRYQDTVGAV